MKKIINSLFSIIKVVLLLISFIFVFYVTMTLYEILGKNILDALDIFVPYFLLLLLLILNYVLHQKQITGNLFYNITCCLVFLVIIFISYRTMFDENMLVRYRSGYNMSFYYFLDMMKPLKAMFYLLIAGNICLMVTKPEEKIKHVVVEKEVDVPKKISDRKKKSVVTR